jgi:hypothetical protein
MGHSTFTDGHRPEYLADKYRMYALRFENGDLVKLHVGRPISFKTFCDQYILQHIELLNQKAGVLFKVAQIVGIEKIPNSNKPDFEVTAEGNLLEIA